jgi:EpsI family protein
MSNKSFTTSLLILLFALFAVVAISFRPVPVVVQTNLERLPMVIGGYTATVDSFSEAIYQALNADKHVYRHYRSQSGDQIDLYIGYYGTAKGGRTGHNPYACLPGAGWAIIESGQVEVHPSYYPQGTRVNYVVASKDGVNNIMLHWYQSAGTRILVTGLQQNIQRFMGRILSNRDDGAFVRVSALVGDQESSKTKEMIITFAQEVLELLPAYWPEERNS